MEHFTQHTADPTLLQIFPTICRCLEHLAGRMSQTENFYVDFAVKVNVPKPHHLAAKFLVQAMQIEHYKLEDLNAILSSMVAVAPLLDDPYQFAHMEELPTPIASLWMGTVPELQKYLTQNGTPLEPQDWEVAMCKFISKTMTARGTEEWVEGGHDRRFGTAPWVSGQP